MADLNPCRLPELGVFLPQSEDKLELLRLCPSCLKEMKRRAWRYSCSGLGSDMFDLNEQFLLGHAWTAVVPIFSAHACMMAQSYSHFLPLHPVHTF